MKTLVIASSNANKINDIKNALSPLSLEIKSMKEMGVTQDPEENGKSYAQNALIKARFTFSACQIPTLADDSGFELDGLGGFPGLVSARFSKACGGFDNAFDILEKCLSENKKALFKTNLALVYRSNGKVREKLFEGKISGEFVYPARGENGFGYCPCFKPEGYDVTLAQMPEKLRIAINHRSIALKKLYRFLQKA